MMVFVIIAACLIMLGVVVPLGLHIYWSYTDPLYAERYPDFSFWD